MSFPWEERQFVRMSVRDVALEPAAPFPPKGTTGSVSLFECQFVTFFFNF